MYFTACRAISHTEGIRFIEKRALQNAKSFFLVEEGGFEPPKLEAADLQSVPFGHSGTPPYTELRKRKLIFIKTGNPFVARRTHCSLETIVIIIHRYAKVNPVLRKFVFFRGGKTLRFWFGLTSSLWGGILYLLRQEAAGALERRILFL